MPFTAETFEPEGADQHNDRDGEPLMKSLFSPIYKGDFSSQDERDIAVYLDGERALKWWHRNVARSHYSQQGWRREKVYPDFIFAMSHGITDNRVVVLEMKGKHLAGKDDTEYPESRIKRTLSRGHSQIFQEQPISGYRFGRPAIGTHGRLYLSRFNAVEPIQNLSKRALFKPLVQLLFEQDKRLGFAACVFSKLYPHFLDSLRQEAMIPQ